MKKFALKVKKNSPEILVIAGVVGMIGSTILACRATTKLGKILEDKNSQIEATKCYIEEKGYSDEYSEADHKNDVRIIKAKSAVKIAKLYAPAAALGMASAGSILFGHDILNRRYTALGAAYAALDTSYKEYKNRIKEKLGEEAEKEIRYGVIEKKFEEVTTDEKGNEKKKNETVKVADPIGVSPYAKFFDDGCKGWEKDPEYNLMFLRQTQQYANDKLIADGYLFLNDVYEMLGIPRTKAGQIVGWVYDKKNPIGDNFVDFGIYDTNREANRDFINGYERVILLDFNVDGNILDLI